jgi:C4-dicarboxylate transporter DctM subunit
MEWTILVVMVLLLVMGFPMMVPLTAGAMVLVFFFLGNIEPYILIQQMRSGIVAYSLLAVPLFIFAADIMSTGKTSNRLVDFVGSFVGHFRGGYAITTAAACTLFGSISGSTQATVVAVGTPMRKKLLKLGYKDSSAIALIINASDIALLIPPSIGMIIYALVADASVGDLFIAGIGPGILIFIFFAIYAVIHAKVYNIPRVEKALWSERLLLTRKALLPLGFPFIIVGGIYMGYFTPTEAAGVSVLYALILEVLIFRSIKIQSLPKIALSTGLVTSAVFILVAAGQAFSVALNRARIPHTLTDAVLGPDPTALTVLFIVAIFFFIGCMFVDPIVVILILTPIFAPVATAAGVDPIHLGVVIVFQAALGSATPPFVVDIFTASAVFNRPYLEVIKGTPPYIAMLIVVAILVILFEDISLFLIR